MELTRQEMQALRKGAQHPEGLIGGAHVRGSMRKRLTDAGLITPYKGAIVQITDAGRSLQQQHAAGEVETLNERQTREAREQEMQALVADTNPGGSLYALPDDSPEWIELDADTEVTVVDQVHVPGYGTEVDTLAIGSTADHIPVTVMSSAGTDTPRIVSGYASQPDAWRDWTSTIVLGGLQRAEERNRPLWTWGERNGVTIEQGAGPAPEWLVLTLDDGRCSFTRHTAEAAAKEEALAAIERIAARLAHGSEVDAIGARWLRYRAADLQRDAAAAAISRAKAGRIVDRYGQINNAQLAALMRVTPQAVGQLVASLHA